MSGREYRAKKRLGQNFLISAKAIGEIVALVEAKKNDTIIEIGPGKGALTIPLAETGAELFAVEFDRDLAPMLESELARFHRARVINMDFLRFQPESHNLSSFKLVGNLPYNITSPVLEWCVKYRHSIKSAVLMMQRELAARVCASPGGRDWSPLSIFTQLRFTARRALEFGPEDFSPRPQVHSSVVLLSPRQDSPPDIPDGFETLVRASFRQRRKQLVNNLVPEIVGTADELRVLLDNLKLKPSARAEELSIELFLKLTGAIAEATIR